MPQAVTHFVITVIILTLIRERFIKKKKDFPMYYVFVGGLAGLLSDFDTIIYWFLYFAGYDYYDLHKTITHSLVFPLMFVLLGLITKKLKSFKIWGFKLKYFILFYIIALGTFIHLLLDGIIAGGV